MPITSSPDPQLLHCESSHTTLHFPTSFHHDSSPHQMLWQDRMDPPQVWLQSRSTWLHYPYPRCTPPYLTLPCLVPCTGTIRRHNQIYLQSCCPKVQERHSHCEGRNSKTWMLRSCPTPYGDQAWLTPHDGHSQRTPTLGIPWHTQSRSHGPTSHRSSCGHYPNQPVDARTPTQHYLVDNSPFYHRGERRNMFSLCAHWGRQHHCRTCTMEAHQEETQWRAYSCTWGWFPHQLQHQCALPPNHHSHADNNLPCPRSDVAPPWRHYYPLPQCQVHLYYP